MTQKNELKVMKNEPALELVRDALAKTGLACESMRKYPKLGFEHPEEGYAVFVGNVLPEFEQKYEQLVQEMPKGYSTQEAFPVSYSHLGRPNYTRWHELNEEKRNLLAKRVLVKKAISSLETRIEEEEREEHEGSNQQINAYYKISVNNVKVGIFIKNPNGSMWPAGF